MEFVRGKAKRETLQNKANVIIKDCIQEIRMIAVEEYERVNGPTLGIRDRSDKTDRLLGIDETVGKLFAIIE